GRALGCFRRSAGWSAREFLPGLAWAPMQGDCVGVGEVGEDLVLGGGAEGGPLGLLDGGEGVGLLVGIEVAEVAGLRRWRLGRAGGAMVQRRRRHWREAVDEARERVGLTGGLLTERRELFEELPQQARRAGQGLEGAGERARKRAARGHGGEDTTGCCLGRLDRAPPGQWRPSSGSGSRRRP